MDEKTLFARAIGQGSACIKQVTDSQLGNDTPCSEWNLRALLNHMVYELLWVPELVKGKTVTQIGDRYEGDVLTHDFHQAWKHAADAALVAVHQAKLDDKAHLSYGDVPMKHYIQEIAGDILLHSWDVAQAINCTLLFDDEMAQTIYDGILPRKDEFAASGLFGKPVTVPESANLQIKLLALVGRSSPEPA